MIITTNTQLVLYNFILVITLHIIIKTINTTNFTLINFNHYYNNDIQFYKNIHKN